jgi:hypothetical protein
VNDAAGLAMADSLMSDWDRHERHVARILIAAGRPDLWRAAYAAYCQD